MTLSSDTDQLLKQARAGVQQARDSLLERHRQRLKRMVAVRLDDRLVPRTDPSDVVQETIIVAHGRLDHYLKANPLPFYPWLRQIAWNQILIHQRRHLDAQSRSVSREEPGGLRLPERSSIQLSKVLIDREPNPMSRLMRQEAHQRVKAALDKLAPTEREVLVLRFLEQLSVKEASAVLQISENAVQMRQLRAIRKLRRLQEDLS